MQQLVMRYCAFKKYMLAGSCAQTLLCDKTTCPG